MTDHPVPAWDFPPVPLPKRSPEADEAPPWRTPRPARPTEAAAEPVPATEQPVPDPIEVRVRYEPYVPEDVPEPTWWDRLTEATSRLGRPWKLLLALGLAVAPIPHVGYSAGTIWAYCVSQTRVQFGIPYGYALAGTALLLAARAVRRNGSFRALLALAVCLIGLTGALSWFDPITALTGVHPR